MKYFSSIIITLLIALLSPLAFAATGDLSISSSNVWVNPGSPVNSIPTTIYVKVNNTGDTDAAGIVSITDTTTGAKVGSDQTVTVLPGSFDDIFVSDHLSYGNHELLITIIPWNENIDNSSNNSSKLSLYVDLDTDGDTIGNSRDADDDGDGVNDILDLFPLDPSEYADSDGDGTGDNADEDADNDGIADDLDAFPTDATEWEDTDEDEIGNNIDDDDDNDSLSDEEEKSLGTNPLKADTDEDDSNDKEDIFPLDPSEQSDSDKDGLGDNIDTDDDNDQIPDIEDEFPFNPAPILAFNDTIVRAKIGEEFILDASSSYDPEGEAITVYWEIDNHSFTQAKISYSFDKKGDYQAYIKVSDNMNQIRDMNFKIHVYDNAVYFWILILLIILLAIVLSFKYIAPASNKGKKKSKSKKK